MYFLYTHVPLVPIRTFLPVFVHIVLYCYPFSPIPHTRFYILRLPPPPSHYYYHCGPATGCSRATHLILPVFKHFVHAQPYYHLDCLLPLPFTGLLLPYLLVHARIIIFVPLLPLFYYLVQPAFCSYFNPSYVPFITQTFPPPFISHTFPSLVVRGHFRTCIFLHATGS